ncbi:MAG: hypothetical protein Kow0068_08670 [Marinilabiliales bacterium]
MNREIGNKNFKIWLLGDSEPQNWKKKLENPLDDRHPIVHNIWTPIIDKIQCSFYKNDRSRIDSDKIFIRNAVDNPKYKPKSNEKKWNDKNLIKNISEYKELIFKHKPILILTFGSFAFEFGRRCFAENPEYSFSYWGAKKLGEEFLLRLNKFSINKSNLVPLLHRSIAGGRFIKSHNYFCDKENANYFKYVAEKLYEKLKDIKDIKI